MLSKKWTLIFHIFRITVYVFVILCIAFYAFLLYATSSITVNRENFLKGKNYSKETLLLFSDIAFPDDKIRKWNEDIKVEIANEDRKVKIPYADLRNKGSISEVDSIINILSPLIYPVKIYRVPQNGNLIVHLNVDSVPIPTKNAQGFCYIPPLIKTFSWNIKYAEVYNIWYSPVIFHEILHAIGLQHPSKEYPFYMAIDDEYTFGSLEEEEKFHTPLYLSEEEKTIIKMLYSPYIKSGLSKKEFLKQMKLQDNDK